MRMTYALEGLPWRPRKAVEKGGGSNGELTWQNVRGPIAGGGISMPRIQPFPRSRHYPIHEQSRCLHTPFLSRVFNFMAAIKLRPNLKDSSQTSLLRHVL